MKQNKLLYNIVKIANEEQKINKEQLDEFLPTDTVATLGDVFLTTSRIGRRSGRAVELANMAGVGDNEVKSLPLKSPLATDQIYAPLTGGAIGATLGGLIGFGFDDEKGAITGAGIGTIGGALLGQIVSRIQRNRKIRKIKQLISEKGKIRTTSGQKIDVPAWYDLGGPSYNYGRAQSRKFLDLLRKGESVENANNFVNSSPVMRNTAELLLNGITAPFLVGSIGNVISDRRSLKAL